MRPLLLQRVSASVQAAARRYSSLRHHHLTRVGRQLPRRSHACSDEAAAIPLPFKSIALKRDTTMRSSACSHAFMILLTVACATGCQLAKPKFLAERQTPSPLEQPTQASASDGRMMVESASKNIDDALNSSLTNKVDSREYNQTSAYTGAYPARTNVTPSKGKGCSSGCSH